MKENPLQALSALLSEILLRPEIARDVQSCPVSFKFESTESMNELSSSFHIDITSPSETGLVDSENTVVLSAPAHVWTEVFKEIPVPGYQSIGALRRGCPDFQVLGSPLNVAQILPLAERVVEYLRLALYPKKSLGKPWDRRVLSEITGRYLCIDTSRDEWVYAEESGNPSGPVLLMLHTAGADSRQWHGLMGVKALDLREWSMHAFDLPGHGRSPLPAKDSNWNWTLTEEDYCRWVLSYMDACSIDRATLMGCSMGSAIALVLLSKYPERFDGAVLLEAPYCSRGRRSVYLNHAQVHGSRLAAAWVGSLLAPQSEKSSRDQATWIYSQGAPGVYDGDLSFYSDDFDANQHTAHIDTQKTPLWLLTGNYDYSASPDETRKIAQEVSGSNFIELEGFGHFPMIENPVGLLPYLKTPLLDILSHAKQRSKLTAS